MGAGRGMGYGALDGRVRHPDVGALTLWDADLGRGMRCGIMHGWNGVRASPFILKTVVTDVAR